MQIPGEWLAPIISGASLVLFDRLSFERVAALRIQGRRYRLRIEIDPATDPGEGDEPEQPPQK
jgi:hypothetical protein